ncbi:TetR family transcriptional regulator [Paucibacter sp. APW11]|uniref:TetR family transcriptional regulator n=1 Tax=Roseateles aquae TaxID=3077235 RepID=A0ABU3P7T8_9BURK|nr:TetR family transcriptional regulator [Paucibacter sp. APW11]MDT8998628.1 TetR family transcriptional regulator [Paucibacter sp. APW11]
MKTSKSQQDKTQRQILAAAVELMSRQGFEATSMKQIAREAGIGDATIYKYFPSKEKLVLGYYELALAEALAQAGKTRGFERFTLQEKLQRLVDAVLERLLPDREFVALTRGLARQSPLLLLGDALPGKAALKRCVQDWLAEAQAAGQIAPCDFQGLVAGMFTDYLFGLLVYWLDDDSEEFANTTQLADLSLSVLVLVLQSGLINKLSDLAGFLLRNQLARLLQGQGGVLELLQLARRGLSTVAATSAAEARR